MSKSKPKHIRGPNGKFIAAKSKRPTLGPSISDRFDGIASVLSSHSMKIQGLQTRISSLESASVWKEWTDWRKDTDNRLVIWAEDGKDLRAQIEELSTKLSQLDNLRSCEDTRLREVEKKLQTADAEPVGNAISYCADAEGRSGRWIVSVIEGGIVHFIQQLLP